METFIINLPKEEVRRIKITEQCDDIGIDYTLIRAINGKDLSPELISTLTLNYPQCNLTTGVIGCALSHLHIYAKMVSEKIPYALILEDDAILDSDAKEILSGISNTISKNKAELFLLNTPEAITPAIKKRVSDSVFFYRMARGCETAAYVLNLKAAKKILDYNLPIKIEADGWTTFRDYCGVKIWCLEQGVINSFDDDKSSSALEDDRAKIISAREHYASVFKKTNPEYNTKRLMNQIIKKFSHRIVKPIPPRQ